MAAGRAHCLAVTSLGRVLAWGNNAYGQCGRPVIEQEDYAVNQVRRGGAGRSHQPLSQVVHCMEADHVTRAVCGQDHSLLLDSAGEVSCHNGDNHNFHFLSPGPQLRLGCGRADRAGPLRQHGRARQAGRRHPGRARGEARVRGRLRPCAQRLGGSVRLGQQVEIVTISRTTTIYFAYFIDSSNLRLLPAASTGSCGA